MGAARSAWQPGRGDCSRVPLPRRVLLSVLAGVAAVLVAATACGGSSSASGCSKRVKTIFWGGTQWLELANGLAAERSDCVEYYVTIPPKDGDRTILRGGRDFKAIRALDPHIHPVAEIRFTSETGWRAWVVGPHPDWAPGRTFYEAGVEARRRMQRLGLDVAAGETWALNELDETILEDVPGRREEVLEFVRGLYEGGPGMPEAAGIVFNIGPFSDLLDVASYKAGLQEWLTDGEFWSDLEEHVDIFADEVYATPVNWGIPGASLEERAKLLNDFFYRLPTLAEAGPDAAEPARAFLRRTFVPLVNASWPHEGLGQTNRISAETMSGFVSTQVYAMRVYADANTMTAGLGGMGFAWAPNPAEPSYTADGRDMVLQRLASAVADSVGDEVAASRACGADGDASCSGDVEGAFANDVWKAFTSWGS
jgi:hypothetical protein